MQIDVNQVMHRAYLFFLPGILCLKVSRRNFFILLDNHQKEENFEECTFPIQSVVFFSLRYFEKTSVQFEKLGNLCKNATLKRSRT